VRETRAQALAHEALATFEAHGWDAGTIESLELLGAVAAQQGTWDRAARILGCITRVRAERELVRVPREPDAARLFISRATVKVHLSHVYAQLGIDNRTELTAIMITHRES
jgi:hypothetical protein